MSSKILQFVILLVLPSLVTAHPISSDSLSQPESTADLIETDVKLSYEVVPGGTTFTTAITINISKGWHINAHNPTLDYLIGTEITVPEQYGFTHNGFKYPDPQKLNFGFAEEAIAVYEDKVTTFATFAVPDTLASGTYSLKGTLRAQACKEQICLSPSTIGFHIPVQISSQSERAVISNKDFFEKFDSETAPIVSNNSENNRNDIAAMFNQQGYFWAFLGIFFIGIALNLTPCIYPMLSVTVSLFGKEKSSTPITYSFAMAFMYVMGIAFMYSILGVVAAYTGSLFGSWLQSPWVTGGIGILVFGLALSMFGLYELQPPLWMRQKLNTMQNMSGAIGHFFSGLVVGVFAAPCIGPPVVALLAFVGSQGDPVFGFFTFFILSLGLGLPYLLLGTFSGLLSKIPQSGNWMVWVKKVFGVVLIGVATFYLAVALYPSSVVNTIPVVLIAGGVYLGFIEQTAIGKKGFLYLKWIVGIASIITGILLIQNLQKPAIEWEAYTSEKINIARKSEQLVILDFYADWCIPCHELEQITYTDPTVIQATSKFEKFKVDLTNYESVRAKNLRKKFNITSVPTVVFIGKDGKEVKKARITGFVDPEEFISRIDVVR